MGAGTCCRIVAHAFDDKAMETVAGPAVLQSQRFENNQRSLSLFGQIASQLQSIIGTGSPEGGHPVKYPVPLGRNGLLVDRANAEAGYLRIDMQFFLRV